MASSINLWVCLNCGEYKKGNSNETSEQCVQHKCQYQVLKNDNFAKIHKLLDEENTKPPAPTMAAPPPPPLDLPPPTPFEMTTNVLSQKSLMDRINACKLKKAEEKEKVKKESSESEDDDEGNKENTAKTKKKKQLPTSVYAELKKVLKKRNKRLQQGRKAT